MPTGAATCHPVIGGRPASCVGRRHRHPRRPPRRRRRHHHGAGDDPAVRHPAGRRQGHVGGRDHPAAIMGTWRNRAKGNTDLRAAAVIGAAGIVTAAIGGTLADKMSDDLSNVLFATLLWSSRPAWLWQPAPRTRRTPRSDISPSTSSPSARSPSARSPRERRLRLRHARRAGARPHRRGRSCLAPCSLLGLTVAAASRGSERGALDWLGIKWALVGRVVRHVRRRLRVSRLDHDAIWRSCSACSCCSPWRQPGRVARAADDVDARRRRERCRA